MWASECEHEPWRRKEGNGFNFYARAVRPDYMIRKPEKLNVRIAKTAVRPQRSSAARCCKIRDAFDLRLLLRTSAEVFHIDVSRQPMSVSGVRSERSRNKHGIFWPDHVWCSRKPNSVPGSVTLFLAHSHKGEWSAHSRTRILSRLQRGCTSLPQATGLFSADETGAVPLSPF